MDESGARRCRARRPRSLRGRGRGWTLPRGPNRVKVGLVYQDTTERYVLDGNRIPYFFEGRNDTTALFFEVARGLTDRWDVQAQISLYRISFDDIADERTSTGPGDLR